MAASSPPQQHQSPYHKGALRPGEIRLLSVESTSSETNGFISRDRKLARRVRGRAALLRLVTRRHKLKDNPEFDAISYVWGTAPKPVSVQCNGAPLLITHTAYEMLEHLRLYRPNLKRPIWIDAICI
ncbi:hypothetical protein EK21DRAFT_89520 [Setomelanomma holmii]|uniref:Heterokaryon incompatibility domain-containing protein n=1 Tax=Setomelanomma holmii TaxID=210430 RepID=A0A9P4HA88_9PLEO|nr:hypothetical protein EK21DRAFT_89520 [Setomelanomma holmii]